MHIWLVGALLGRNIGQVIVYLGGGALLGTNMGQVITYLVSRSASWEKNMSSYYIFGRHGCFLEGIWVKLLHIWSVGALLGRKTGRYYYIFSR